MDGHSKMKGNGNGNGNGKSSGSTDHSSPDRSPFPQPPNPTPNNQPNPEPIKNAGRNDPLPEKEENLEGITSGPKLRRNNSVSSAYALQAAVNRAFSTQRSSSVSERYSRIHDQSVTLETVQFDDEQEAEDTVETVRSGEKKKKRSRSKILKAWKKLFGL
ncbi:hypothetical protein SLE2022_146440 [Rubroshorea leprosula]